MAQGDKKKKSNGGGQSAKAGEKAAAAAAAAAAKKSADAEVEAAPAKKESPAGEKRKKAAPDEKAAVPAKAARVEEHHEDEAHGAGAHAGHGHKVNRREYFVIFVVLFVLTVLEVAVAQLPGVGKVAIGVALVGLAVTKAACVGLFYMHLKHETRILRYMVALPMATPAIYAFVLIADSAWRLTR
jgi:caa(3)-type oxidase subunit IV